MVVLNAFHVGNSHTTSVAQEVRHQEDTAFCNHFVGFGSCGAVGGFGNHLHVSVNLMHSFACNLAFKRGRNNHVHILGKPGVAIFNQITGCFGFFFVDGAILIGDALQEHRVDAIFFGESVGFAVFAVPAGNADHFSTHVKGIADGDILTNITKTLQCGFGFFGVDAKVFHGFANVDTNTKTGRFGAAF